MVHIWVDLRGQYAAGCWTPKSEESEDETVESTQKQSHIVELELAVTVPPHHIFGLDIPFESPVLLTVLGFHVLAALVAVVTGIIAMLSAKHPGRRPGLGRFTTCASVSSSSLQPCLQRRDGARMRTFFSWEQDLCRRQHWDAPHGADDGIGGYRYTSVGWDSPIF